MTGPFHLLVKFFKLKNMMDLGLNLNPSSRYENIWTTALLLDTDLTVIGRKNWLFHGSDIGASAGSILFSLIETCKAHKIDTFAWFKYALTYVTQANAAL